MYNPSWLLPMTFIVIHFNIHSEHLLTHISFWTPAVQESHCYCIMKTLDWQTEWQCIL